MKSDSNYVIKLWWSNKKHQGKELLPWPNLMQMRSSTMQIPRESQTKAPTFFTVFLSCRYELYSRIVGIAMIHHNINLYVITGLLGGIHRQNFKKKVLSSTIRNTTHSVRISMNLHGPRRGCHSSLSHCAGVNWPNVRFTYLKNYTNQ